MSDHVRKYNDWNIKRPSSVSGGATSPDVDETDQTDTVGGSTPQQLETSVFESGEPIGNPFIDTESSRSTINGGEPDVVETAHAQQAFSEISTSEEISPARVVDTDTGLEIPDYMKPFVKE